MGLTTSTRSQRPQHTEARRPNTRPQRRIPSRTGRLAPSPHAHHHALLEPSPSCTSNSTKPTPPPGLPPTYLPAKLSLLRSPPLSRILWRYRNHHPESCV